MTDTAPTVEAGRLAWERLRGDRKTWADWLAVGRAVQVGRTEAMKAAKTNRCVGSRYNLAMGAWLRDNGLDGVTAQERYRLLRILEHLTEIGTWRAGLDEGKRRTLNHPSAIWSHWRRSLKPAPSPQRQHLTERVTAATEAARQGRAVFWPQDALRRAHLAMLKSKSSDMLILARAALEAAIRSEADLLALLPAEPKTKPPPRPAEAPAAVAVHA